MELTTEKLPLSHISHELDQELRYANDTETWMAEMLYGSMRTSFDFSYDGSVLRSKDGGSMDEVFDDAIESAQLIAYENPSLLFELRRRLIERGELDDMQAMVNGELYTDDGEQVNTIVVISDFPPELMEATEDVGGYNASRKQAMLRVITLKDGEVEVLTQSLDGSNREALEAVSRKVGKIPEEGELLSQRINLNLPPEWQPKLADNLTDTYDESLAEQLGGSWHAGIRQPDNRAYINTYEFARSQTDLIDWFAKEKAADPIGAESLRFQLAATAKARYERFIKDQSRADIVMGNVAPESLINIRYISGAHPSLAQELLREGQKAAERGETFSGCGVTVTAQESVSLSVAGSIARELGYGNKSSSKSDEDCEYISKECPSCHEKNVKTYETKTHITGKCGCSIEKKPPKAQLTDG
jgi:hypothetical protein